MSKKPRWLSTLVVLLTSTIAIGGCLYPQATETRDLMTLDGIWNFRQSPIDPNYGYDHKWFEKDLVKTGPVIPMPVPSSYNDVGVDMSLRDHVGLVWYDRRFHVPPSWSSAGQRVWLRFSSVHYFAEVWVNGISVTHHEIGHLPFEVEIGAHVRYNDSNLLTVAVNNTLNRFTVPQGNVRKKTVNNTVHLVQTYSFDFFNYAGIHRAVLLYSTPQTYIDDVTVNTTVHEKTGNVSFKINYKGSTSKSTMCLVQLFDKNEKAVASAKACEGSLKVDNANFWWPVMMHPNPGYLYTMKLSLESTKCELMDTYYQKVGIRTVTWTNTSVFLNCKPLYLKGFGMHEDFSTRGKGWDPVVWTRNFELIRWIGANAFRTSHYPYAEEVYQLADEQGIMIIDECPIVDTQSFSDKLLDNHKRSLTELIHRDKNHPSVIMWSIANEPHAYSPAAEPYFGEVVRHVKALDILRPITIANAVYCSQNHAAKHLDVIAFNRYNGWYQGRNHFTEDVVRNVVNEAHKWHKTHNKPVFITEYGGDAIAGQHHLPHAAWTEDYQAELLSEHFTAFNKLRDDGFFFGELVWVFADFNTLPSHDAFRAGGNHKGLFTRSRQPKLSAHSVRKRYLELNDAE